MVIKLVIQRAAPTHKFGLHLNELVFGGYMKNQIHYISTCGRPMECLCIITGKAYQLTLWNILTSKAFSMLNQSTQNN